MARLQLAINVDDLDTSIDFYRRLFATEPAKARAERRGARVLQLIPGTPRHDDSTGTST